MYLVLDGEGQHVLFILLFCSELFFVPAYCIFCP